MTALWGCKGTSWPSERYVLAAGIQGMVSGSALRKLSTPEESEGSRLRHRVARSQRIAAALLAVTVTCMAAARYA